MPRAARTVHVAPIEGESLRYRVESWTRPDRPHMVDLASYGGCGECSCKDWVTRRGPFTKANPIIGAPESMCRHIIAARNYLINGALRDMSAALNSKP